MDAPVLDYDLIAIIYNPNSTGNAADLACELKQQLEEALNNIEIQLLETSHPGHGEELAYKLASRHKWPVIVSVSGDGGYHDVVNGAMRAATEHGSEPVCAVRGAGNANDHRQSVKELPLFESIISKNIRLLDLLIIRVTDPSGDVITRYAHSYAGLGLTPVVAVELNRHTLNRWRELILTARTFIRANPFQLERAGQRRQYDNIIFGNINRMAKVVTLSSDSSPTDGVFEVIEMPHRGKLRQLLSAVRAALFSLSAQSRQSRYEFKTVNDLPMQLDGEVLQLTQGSRVSVGVVPGALRTLV